MYKNTALLSLLLILTLIGLIYFALSRKKEQEEPVALATPLSQVTALQIDTVTRNKLLKSIQYIEDKMQSHMPETASPLEKYQRFYAYSEIDGYGAIIWGTYLADIANINTIVDYIKPKNINTVPGFKNVYFLHKKNMPLILDGGCSVIQVNFDIKSQQMTLFIHENAPEDGKPQYAICNGHA